MANLDLSPDSYADAAGFDGDWRDSWHNADFLALMAKRWGLCDLRRILDVGSGHGHWGQALLPLMHHKARLVGIDHEAEFLMAAQRRAKQKGLGARTGYVRGDAMTLPFDDERFDLVTCQTVLVHVANAERAIGEMIRVLKPGGRIALVEPNNLALAATWLMSDPRPSRDDYLRLLELQWTCEQGKIALEEGDQSIGERLPAMLGKYGLKVEVYNSDRAPAYVPPYADPAIQLDLEMQLPWAKQGTYIPVGNREVAERLFVAGEGAPDRFEELWAAAQRRMSQFVQAVEAGKFSGARGLNSYFVSATKP